MTRLKEQYDSQIKAAMMKKFGYKNEMQIPKLVKIVVNMLKVCGNVAISFLCS